MLGASGRAGCWAWTVAVLASQVAGASSCLEEENQEKRPLENILWIELWGGGRIVGEEVSTEGETGSFIRIALVKPLSAGDPQWPHAATEHGLIVCTNTEAIGNPKPNYSYRLN